MYFNTKKCHILSISHQRLRPVPAYKIGPDHLTAVDSNPYLGVTISSDLRWNIHINNVCARATRTLNCIRRNIYKCPPDSKSLAFNSLVKPHLEYASGAWDPHTAKNVNSLEMVQRRAARFVKNDYRCTTSASSLIDGLGWSTLSNRRKLSRLCSFYKAYNRLSTMLDHFAQPSVSFNTFHCWYLVAVGTWHTGSSFPIRNINFKINYNFNEVPLAPVECSVSPYQYQYIVSYQYRWNLSCCRALKCQSLQSIIENNIKFLIYRVIYFVSNVYKWNVIMICLKCILYIFLAQISTANKLTSASLADYSPLYSIFFKTS